MKKLDIQNLDKNYEYKGKDLGYSRVDGKHMFKVWTPLADGVSLCVYEKYKDDHKVTYPMIKGDKGIWQLSLDENISINFYTYEVTIDDKITEAVDPYAKALSVNGLKGAVVDISTTNPKGWHEQERPEVDAATDMIIYEMHTKDFSIQEESGIQHKGKFLGIAEEGTQSPTGETTGLDHIKEMGVTHVQLLPIYDYGSVDEESDLEPEYENKSGYNWGYDPENYNAPEGSYSTNPYEPACRILELKTAIQALHNKGLCVIMDVVYNHMYDVGRSSFHKIMPGYYFRYDAEGNLADESGCGNAVASEHAMVRRFIVDSVVYWAKEYKLDGFRFDLMGLIDVTTMNEIKEELMKINPKIKILGEGWNMGTTLSDEDKAIQQNAHKMKGIGFFNDGIRDALRGSTFVDTDKGFLGGAMGLENQVKQGIVGGIHYSDEIQSWGEVEPGQVANYIECHDNHTLFDKLKMQVESEDEIAKLARLGGSIILLSQGVPFIHAGQEFLRTKNGDENSYKSNDSINKLDWVRKGQEKETVDYFKGLIQLRKEESLFRLNSSEKIRQQLKFIETPSQVIAYDLLDEEGQVAIRVIHNGNRETVTLTAQGQWKVLVEAEQAGPEAIREIHDNLEIQPLETLVLKK